MWLRPKAPTTLMKRGSSLWLVKHATGGARVTKTCPNNASGVVWAISEFFFSFLLLFGILTKVYSIYNCNLQKKISMFV